MNLSDQPVVQTTQTIVSDAPITELATSSSDYKPVVGDVVEWSVMGENGKGIVFSGGYAVECEDGQWFSVSNGDITGFICSTGLMAGISQHADARGIAKAYFSKPTFTGTYAEKQKQWIEHHGLKVGSKVKVVREFADNEDGGIYGPWDYCKHKAGMQGKIYEISYIDKSFINVGEAVSSYPYFALEPVTE